MTPPRLATLLLTRLLPADVREALLGDLEEEYRTRILPARGPRRARWWFWKQTFAAIPLVRVRPARTPAPVRNGDHAMIAFLNEARLGFRRLVRAPGYSAVACVTLALGIGGTTAIFSVVNPVLFESLPYPDPGRIVAIGETDPEGGMSNTGYATFADLRRDSRLLNAVAAMSYWSPIIGGESEPERVQGQSVSHDFFRVLGIEPALGRGFLAEEDAPGRNLVAVLSHGLWQRRFGGDSSLVGRPITVSGVTYTLVGVMPREFESLLAPDAVIWRPLGYDASLSWACRTCRHLRAVGRVRAGVTPAALDRELDLLSARYFRDHPTDYPMAGMEVESLQDRLVRPVRGALLLVLGAVALVLLMAATNVANLGLGRAVQRESEFAIRAALGAGRRHLIRQLLTEHLLLAVIGGLGGLALAWLSVRGLTGLAPAEIPRLAAVRLDGDVLMVAVAAVLTTGLVAGLAPALVLLRSDLQGAMRRSAAGATSPKGRRLVRRGLVVLEMALALSLMTGAGLLIRSVQRLLGVQVGFEPAHLLTLTIQTSGPAYADDAPVRAVQRRVLEAVRAVPGVSTAALASQIPLGGNFDGNGVLAEDKPLDNPELAPGAQRYAVSPEYLRSMGIPLRRGRALSESDREDTPPVVLVNEALAGELWPGEDPLGKRIRVGGPTRPWREVVGVVGNTLHMSLDDEVAGQFYAPLPQWPWADNPVLLVVRAAGDPALLTRAVREAVRSVDGTLAISDVATMDERVTVSAAQRRFAMLLFQAFALVAVLLAATGLFGVLSGSVTERARELGIRSALGATRRRLLGLVVREGLLLASIGLAAGLAGAAVLAHLLRRLIFGIAPHDPATLAAVALLLLVVALVACLAPAWRAARVDPAAMLRSG